MVVAAGNEGRPATGQILLHPASVPVAAVNQLGELLPESNYGTAISLRGVSANGQDILGYAPGGVISAMSGTSVAAAVATGILAQAWSVHPDFQASDLLAAVHRLKPRGELPPLLTLDLCSLSSANSGTLKEARAPEAEGGRSSNHSQRQGKTTMADVTKIRNQSHSEVCRWRWARTRGSSRRNCRGDAPVAVHGAVLRMCKWRSRGVTFRLCAGSVDIRFPDPSISEELQGVAGNIKQKANQELRDWYRQVLKESHARYVARQLCWVLTIEGLPAYYLALRDLNDLIDLITCLSRPRDEDLCLFVGSSSLAPVEALPGIRLPVLNVEQLSCFEKPDIIKWFDLPRRRPRSSSRRSFIVVCSTCAITTATRIGIAQSTILPSATQRCTRNALRWRLEAIG